MPRKQSGDMLFMLPFIGVLGFFAIFMLSLAAQGAGGPTLPLGIIFALIVSVLLVFFIKKIIKTAQTKKLKQEGKDGVGKYVSHISNLAVNGTSYYKVFYTFESDNGAPVEIRTPSIYLEKEAVHLQRLGAFKIKHNNLKAVIVEDLTYAQPVSRFGNNTFNNADGSPMRARDMFRESMNMMRGKPSAFDNQQQGGGFSQQQPVDPTLLTAIREKLNACQTEDELQATLVAIAETVNDATFDQAIIIGNQRLEELKRHSQF